MEEWIFTKNKENVQKRHYKGFSLRIGTCVKAF